MVITMKTWVEALVAVAKKFYICVLIYINTDMKIFYTFFLVITISSYTHYRYLYYYQCYLYYRHYHR